MRWNDLFADLENQAQAWERAELDVEVADRSRAEQATVALVDRLLAARGSSFSSGWPAQVSSVAGLARWGRTGCC